MTFPKFGNIITKYLLLPGDFIIFFDGRKQEIGVDDIANASRIRFLFPLLDASQVDGRSQAQEIDQLLLQKTRPREDNLKTEVK